MYNPDVPLTKKEQIMLNILCAMLSNANCQIGSVGLVALAHSYLQEFEEKAETL